MRLKNGRNGPIVPVANSSRKANSILALDGLVKVILVRKKGRVRLSIVSHVKVVLV
jgi:hypothetical protein